MAFAPLRWHTRGTLLGDLATLTQSGEIMVRYIVASTIAVGLTVAGAIFARITQAYAASLGGPGRGIELPSSTIWRIWLSDVMIDFWWFLIPLVFILCFGIARMFRPAAQNPAK